MTSALSILAAVLLPMLAGVAWRISRR